MLHRRGGGAAAAPARQQHGVGLESAHGSHHQVVEVEAAGRGDRRLVRDECSGDRARLGVGRDLAGGHAKIELQPRDRGVELTPAGWVDVLGDTPQDKHPIDERFGRGAGIAQDLEAQRVECPHPDHTGGNAERLQRRTPPRVLRIISRSNSW